MPTYIVAMGFGDKTAFQLLRTKQRSPDDRSQRTGGGLSE
jgi:hypothetical protein